MVVSSAFTTSSAWAATQPQTNPQVNPCLAYGVNSAAYLKCMENGTKQNSGNTNGSQNRGSNLNSKTVTLNQSNSKNNSNSSSNNQNTSNQQGKNIGKVPFLNTKGSPQLLTPKVNTLSLNTKGTPQQFNPKVNVQSLNTKRTPQQFNLKVNVQSLNTKETPQIIMPKVKLPSFANNQSRDNSIIQSFEKVTGHHLTSAELRAVDDQRFVNSEDEAHFIRRLEDSTGRRLNNAEVSEVGNYPITVIAGYMSNLNGTDTQDTFLIGNTTIQLSTSIMDNFTIQNGEYIKLDGYFTSSEYFVVTQIVSVIQ